MSPPPQPDPDSRVQIERRILCALCQRTLDGSTRDRALQELKSYAWREPVHHAIFKCLTQLPAGNPELLRSELPACLTRKGFPDVDWDGFFTSSFQTQREALQAVLDLVQTQSSNPAKGGHGAGVSHPSEKP
jgi:hypothetical protein